MSSYSNYFIGNDAKAWHAGVPNYGEVEFSNLYPGIDVHYYGNNRQLEYDVIVKPSADPKAIRISLGGSADARLDSSGDVIMPFGSGEFRLHKPRIYQIRGRGAQDPVSGDYVLSATNEFTFEIGAYDRRRDLIIDPVLSYSTYLGGTGDDLGNGIAVDRNGNAYVAGWTGSINFPVANAYQNHDNAPTANAFLTKFSRDGKSVVFSTYLGGSDASGCGGDYGWALALNPAGEAYVAGQAYSIDFPVTANAYQQVGGGCSTSGGGGSGFVTRFSADGKSLLYSTYFGGNAPLPTSILAIALDTHGNAYVTGFDQSYLLGTPGAFQSTLDTAGDEGAFVAKLSASGSRLIYGTYVRALQSGNTVGSSIAVDALGRAFITGIATTDNFPVTTGAFQTTFGGTADAFVTAVNASGSGLLYSTYLGGGDYDYGTRIAVDSTGSAYVTGTASSTDFPTTFGAFQSSFPGGASSAFVTKLAANGATLLYSTYLGGNLGSVGAGIAISPLCKNKCSVYAHGSTQSTIFPVRNPIKTTGDLFVATLNAAGSQLGSYSTRFGASSGDFPTTIAIDGNGNAYITGWTHSASFPTTPAAFQPNYGGGIFFGDAYVAKIGAK